MGTLRLGTARLLGHCRKTWRLGSAGKLVVFALQGYLALRNCRDILRLGTTARILGGWALEGHLVVERCRDT